MPVIDFRGVAKCYALNMEFSAIYLGANLVWQRVKRHTGKFLGGYAFQGYSYIDLDKNLLDSHKITVSDIKAVIIDGTTYQASPRNNQNDPFSYLYRSGVSVNVTPNLKNSYDRYKDITLVV